MDNSGIRGFALKMLEQRLTPQQKSSPDIQAALKAIRDNDYEAGSRIASQFCQSMGVSKESALQQAVNMCENLTKTLNQKQ